MPILNYKKKVVYVIGAGASKEATLPTSHELKSEIANLLDIRFDYDQVSGDYIIADALRALTRDINPFLREAWHIRDALPQAISIDHFIDAQRNNEKIAICAKLAIVRSILEAEKKSLLYFEKERIDSNINFHRLQGTWYIPFFQLVTENCEKDELSERFNSITIIIFNYDRCIEHFIYGALLNYYRLSEAEAANLVKIINIYHPYGYIGSLPWMKLSSAMEFGKEPNHHQLLSLSERIKTFTEGTDPESSEILTIREHMGMADRIVFLGFAFHPMNMQLLTPRIVKDSPKAECFATAYKISDSDKEVIERQLKELYYHDIKIKMENLTCVDFFKHFWRSLSFK